MSGKKKLQRATRDKRVIAYPSKKVADVAVDSNGNVIRDKNGNAVTETKQLYRIRPLR